MITDAVLTGKQIHLRQIALEDCTEEYVGWLNDSEVNQYLETKWSEQNMESIRFFVESQRENNHSILFAILENETERHIGNIKIGPVHPHYKHADISYFIGEKDYWHKGIATEAIKLVSGFGFNELHLHRIEAGAYDCAVGSWRALERCGFKREGVFTEQVILKGSYIDTYRYALLESEYAKLKEGV